MRGMIDIHSVWAHVDHATTIMRKRAEKAESKLDKIRNLAAEDTYAVQGWNDLDKEEILKIIDGED